jgi:translation elongation factor EF-Tu-like GTPase
VLLVTVNAKSFDQIDNAPRRKERGILIHHNRVETLIVTSHADSVKNTWLQELLKWDGAILVVTEDDHWHANTSQDVRLEFLEWLYS